MSHTNPDIWTEARALYADLASRVAVPAWDQLGDTTKLVWYDKAVEIRTVNGDQEPDRTSPDGLDSYMDE